ncbi:MAG: amino acid permease [Candidatus Delongbacteria bacterium]|nr:amino acid permease [Candidatus Delongbacteria bacterium]
MSNKSLKKELGLLDVFSIASGAMISSGLFILPGLAYVQAGPGMILAYLLAGLLAATGMLSQSELISAMPKAGGTYFFVTRSMGPAVGTIDGMITWFSVSLKSAFALIGMAAFTRLIIDIDIHVIAIVFCAVFLIINIIGAKEAGRFQIVIVFLLIGLLIFYVIDGLIYIDVQNFTPFAPNGAGSIFSTAGLVFVSYGGLLKIASISEETKNPTRNLPLGMLLAFFVVGILYALVVFVTTGVLGDKLGTTIENASITPITDGAAVFMGEWGVIALTIAAILAFVSTANAGVLAASRYPLALSRDKLIPSFFGKLSRRSKTPYVSILFTGLFITLSFMLKLDVLIKAASTVIIFTFIFSCLAVIILRESRVQNYQPKFKSPLYPWVQIVGIIGFLLLVFEMGLEAILTSLGLGFIGFLTYWFYGKKKTESEYALLHLIERITNKQFLTGGLESELKDIIRERDDIVKDRFDHLVEKRNVLDIKHKVSKEELFELIAKNVSEKLNITNNSIYELLTAREAESSTALTPFLAIPHIIIEGEKIFEMLVIRSKKGIELSDEHKDIKAIFVLLGTKDERNFHLRVISAIAQIVRDPDFEKKWIAAKNPENLRDVILLGKRVRM